MKTATKTKKKTPKKPVRLEAVLSGRVLAVASALEMFIKPRAVPDSFEVKPLAEAPFGIANRERIIKADVYGLGWEPC